jgi:hypothetical protein
MIYRRSGPSSGFVRIYLFQDEISCLQGEIPLRQSGAGDFLVLRLRKKGWCIVEFLRC